MGGLMDGRASSVAKRAKELDPDKAVKSGDLGVSPTLDSRRWCAWCASGRCCRGSTAPAAAGLPLVTASARPVTGPAGVVFDGD